MFTLLCLSVIQLPCSILAQVFRLYTRTATEEHITWTWLYSHQGMNGNDLPLSFRISAPDKLPKFVNGIQGQWWVHEHLQTVNLPLIKRDYNHIWTGISLASWSLEHEIYLSIEPLLPPHKKPNLMRGRTGTLDCGRSMTCLGLNLGRRGTSNSNKKPRQMLANSKPRILVL